jgi:adenine-specific DNA-methyltransferase
MEASFNQNLINLLKKDVRFVDEDGELVKSAVIDHAWKIDRGLVKLLLSDKEVKGKFFDEIEKHWIFNINTFIEYVSDKNFLDNSYTRFKNKIGLTIDGKYLNQRGEVALVWPYKDCVLEGGQTKEEEKRKEIFFNEILAQDEIDRLLDPKVLTNFKRYTAEGEKKVTELKRDEDGIIRENLIIKGNNLLVLNTLITQFRGQVKLIYIDPPYNIGGDTFGYNDNFNHSSWLTFMKNRLEASHKLLNKEGSIFIQIDYHEVAYLMAIVNEIFGVDNFVQMISIKTATPAGFKVVNPGPVNVTEFILMYTKNKCDFNFKHGFVESTYQNDYNLFIENFDDKPGKWKITKLREKVIEEIGFDTLKKIKDKFGNNVASLLVDEKTAELAEKYSDRVFASYGPHKPSNILQELMKASEAEPDKIFVQERESKSPFIMLNGRLLASYKNKLKEIDGKVVPAQLLTDFWNDLSWDSLSFEGGVKLKNGKKPEKLIKRIIDISTEPNEIVMDFCLGSGTTAAVAHKMGRQYVGIEQLDYGDNDSVTRLKNVIGKKKKGLVEEYENFDQSGISNSVNWQGGGDFIYCELMKYNEIYMDKIQEAETSKDLVRLWKEISENSFLNWYVNPELPEEAIKDFEDIGKGENGLDKQKRLLCELLNKNQLYVNLSEIDDKKFTVSKEDKELNKAFYGQDF